MARIKMNFIGRTDELKKLNKVFSLDEFTTSLIFGRRRVGKSDLIKTALKKIVALKYIMNVKKYRKKVTLMG